MALWLVESSSFHPLQTARWMGAADVRVVLTLLAGTNAVIWFTGCDMKSGMSIRALRLRSVVSGVLHAAVWCALVVGVGYGQTSQDQVDEILSQKVRSVIDFLKQGIYGPATQEQIAEAQAGRLCPIL